MGEILHFTKSGRIIVKCTDNNSMVRTGSIIMDEKNRKLGKVSELIGPINSPYASLIPYIHKKDNLKGQKAFIFKSVKDYPKKSKIKRNKK